MTIVFNDYTQVSTDTIIINVAAQTISISVSDPEHKSEYDLADVSIIQS
jgi:hypothetical protein